MLYRKVIRICAEDSPNVRLALLQQKRGEEPTGEILVPGVLTWLEYQYRRRHWDKKRQCVGLDARFYEGPEVKLFPPDWLGQSARRALDLKGTVRKAEAIGVDPAEGGDKTAIAVVDKLGLIELQSIATPDTSVIRGLVLDAMRRYNLEGWHVIFDAGGGGKQIADQLRADGYGVNTAAFGSAPVLELKRGLRRISEMRENREDRSTYTILRDQMYDELRQLLDPGRGEEAAGIISVVFAISAEHAELHRQLSLIPLTYDKEGRLKLLPKNKPGEGKDGTLIGLIGHSPDESDALVLAVHCMLHKKPKPTVGVLF